jgi:hypothetical protein
MYKSVGYLGIAVKKHVPLFLAEGALQQQGGFGVISMQGAPIGKQGKKTQYLRIY